jgi:single-strand DNA-binding protein
MASVNKVILMGNCGRDPEIRYLPSGQAVANVSIATTTRRKDKTSGENVETTEWHRITFFDRLAEIAGEYLKKGNPVYVEGRIKYGKFTNKDGVEQNTCDIVATEMQLLGSKQDALRQDVTPRSEGKPNAYSQASGASNRTPAARPVAQGSGFDDMDDDISF